MVLLKLAVGFLYFVLFRVHLDARWAERQETLWVFAEVEDQLFGMEGAVPGLIL